MVKLVDILREVAEENNATKIDQAKKILQDLEKELGQLEEGKVEDAIKAAAAKLKKLGLSAALATTVLTALPGATKAQQQAVSMATGGPETTQLVSFGKSGQVTTDMLKDWADFIEWLDKTTVGDIDGSKDTAKLKGNVDLDDEEFNDQVLAAYKKLKPNSKILDKEEVKKFQEAMVNHRNATIASDQTNAQNPRKGVELAGGKFRQAGYDNYLPYIKKIEDKKNKEGSYDGFIGQYTSQTMPPRDLTTSTKLGGGVERTAPKTQFAPTPKM